MPGLEIDWLAQEPVTTVLRERGETIHPASAELASEADAHRPRGGRARPARVPGASGGWTRSSARTSCSSTTSCARSAYDLWIGDEAWEVDHFLHENPELKTAPYAWLTDFVGFLPMPAGGEREAFLTADYNAEMIEHVERYPRVRDRAIFVGDPEDVVAATLRARAAGDPRLDRAPLRVRRLRARLRPGARSRPGGAARASSATATSRSASSPSAAPASARRCCAA